MLCTKNHEFEFFSVMVDVSCIFCSSIWVQVLNRTQNRLALLRIPCSAFRPIASNAIVTSENFPRQHKIDVMLEESSDYWINVIFLVCCYVVTSEFVSAV